ncbi:non-hydrolyzing UDP-N-acetylglucosamine 2-epimerase [Alteriqipengyuania lutimaris]|uniref:UDP-N-acetylglucosamine 2-epimerase (non-hydrolyzing) n=1 Tax=Alteriqipengyuania lutimaris TaxID=1538146 RepID=A0A395LPS4_9SPHN|nr:UDP-N-acetylglucosamine 2-epimerase (non-hydrolyzing) [Alteriqipengyuania lutimaris]MBB3034388.1 UDP-N-acetylglucosamine 2-epimerase (non-hydrolyzing) [Alteriqipengyuania lutimaris]RDS76710.1 UDP-N-acetylglucosamine 2-epimerase (non-hydrolyzing) [Alteriqipengyuania lutimaris]
MARILVVFGTRPEAIKMFPVVHALRSIDALETRVAVTAQHRELLDQVLDIAGIRPDIDLDLMKPGQSLDELASRILLSFGQVLDEVRPDRVLVHGDTLTTMMVTLSAYFRRIPVGHVEAGLRSGNIYSPWPEEVNRRVTGVVSDLHFAPTARAAEALRAENITPQTVHVTGNTVIDALLKTREIVLSRPALTARLDPIAARFQGRRIIAVTAHRRENFGEGMASIAGAIRDISEREGVAVIFPVHPNPQVRPIMERELADRENVALIEPLDYPQFVRLMEMSDIVLTDSGGVQEEAPSLGKPVLVMRDTTERPEGIAAGTARLVATDRARIVAETVRLLDDRSAYDAMSQAHNPYGDGTAAERIARLVARAHGL